MARFDITVKYSTTNCTYETYLFAGIMHAMKFKIFYGVPFFLASLDKRQVLNLPACPAYTHLFSFE